MAYRINEKNCTCCGMCEPVCPVSCISTKESGKRIINEKECLDCSACADECPAKCISQV